MLELLLVFAVISLLAAIILTALGDTKEKARLITCKNNLKQINLSLFLYASGNGDVLPPPVQPAGYWPLILQPNYNSLRVLTCPDDASAVATNTSTPFAPDLAPRSYMINAFSDYYASLSGTVGPTPIQLTKPWLLRMKHSVFNYPAATITFGEKAGGSIAFFVDIFQTPTSSYLAELAENRHDNPSGTAYGGGANYAMADGGVRYLAYGEDTCPLNFWAVLDQWRRQAAVCRPK